MKKGFTSTLPGWTLRLVLLLSMSLSLHAHAEDLPSKDKPRKATPTTHPIKETTPAIAEVATDKQYSKKADFETQLMLEEALKGSYSSNVKTKAVAKDYMMDVTEQLTEAVTDARNNARGTFQYLDSKGDGAYKETVSYDDLVVLPLGLRKQIGNTTADIGIMQASFFPDHAELTVFVRLKTKITDPNATIKEREIFFGADRVSFTKEGGIKEFDAVLLGDFILNMGKWTVVLKGGLDIATGTIDKENSTYATIDCGQFREAQLIAEVVFPRDVLVPLGAAPTYTPLATGRVTGKFRATITEGFEDLYVSVDFKKPNNEPAPFAIADYTKVGFIVNEMVLDMSDKLNTGEFPAALPTGYGTIDERWQGFYVKNLTAILPGEFQEKDKPTARLTVGVRNLIFDSAGISGEFKMGDRKGVSAPILSIDKGNANSWAFSLQKFDITISKNTPIRGNFEGEVQLPMAPNMSAQESDKGVAENFALGYVGKFEGKGAFSIDVILRNDLKFAVWNANVELEEGSTVKLATKVRLDGSTFFDPEARLHGKMGIQTSLKGENKTSDANAAISFKGITFRDLVLNTTYPYIHPEGKFGYENTSREMGNFPVTLEKVGLTTVNGKTALDVKIGVTLMSGSFGGKAGFCIPMTYDNGSGSSDGANFKLKLDEFILKELEVKGKVSGFALEGRAELYDEAGKKGFRGRMKLNIEKPEIEVCAAAEFGFAKTAGGGGYRFWQVEARAGIPESLPIYLVPGIVKINSISAAVYHNMAAVAGSGTDKGWGCVDEGRPNVTPVSYQPNSSIDLGFKGVLGLQASSKELFSGFAGLELVISKNRGLEHVGIFGEGVFGGLKLPGGTGKFIDDKYGKIVEKQNELIESAGLDDTKLGKKASKQFEAPKGAGGDMSGSIRAVFGMMYNAQTKTFTGDAEAFVNMFGGVIRGIGENSSAGRINILISPDKWYVHVGNSKSRSTRLGLQADLGVINASTTAYFMVGHDIPDLPCPLPAIVQAFNLNCNKTPDNKDLGYNQADKAKMKLGKGFAMGADLAFEMGIDVTVAEVNIKAGAGFDLLAKTNPTPPAGCSADFGMGDEHFYTQGQFYAYLDVNVRVLFLEGRAAAYALLQIGAPNPIGIRGDVALTLEIAGIELDGNFGVDIGNTCALNQ
jgi:hypothetical protein